MESRLFSPFGDADVGLGLEVMVVPEVDVVKNEVARLEAVVGTVVVEQALVLVVGLPAVGSRLLLDV